MIITGGTGVTIGKFFLIAIISQFIILSIIMIITGVIGLIGSRTIIPTMQQNAIIWGLIGILLGSVMFYYTGKAFNWASCLWCEEEIK